MMEMIQWSDSLSVNVTAIDLQHKKMISIMNDLYDAMMSRQGKACTSRVLGGLVDYTQTHFKTEETYLEQYQFPGLSQHKREHREFIQKISGLKDDFERGHVTVNTDTMVFLCDWLRGHIKGTDQEYTTFLNQHGVH